MFFVWIGQSTRYVTENIEKNGNRFIAKPHTPSDEPQGGDEFPTDHLEDLTSNNDGLIRTIVMCYSRHN